MRPSAERQTAALFVGRVFEQGALAVAMLLLGGRTEPADFALVSVLLIVNSIAMSASDYGLGLDTMRLAAGSSMATSGLRRVRAVNLAIATVGVVAGFVVGSGVGRLVGASAIVWALSAEVYVRKASALRLGNVRGIVRSDVLSAFVLVGIVGMAGRGDRALVVLAGALLAKYLIELVVVGRWRESFHPNGQPPRPLLIWLTQIQALLIANVDYLVVGVMLGPAPFAVYVMGYRLAGAAPTLVSNAANRVAVVALRDLRTRAEVYVGLTRRLFLLGVVIGGLTAACSPLVPVVLGSQWDRTTAVLVVLSVGIPWRLVTGLAGSLLVAVDRASMLARLEWVRFVVVAGALVAGAALGFMPVVAVAALAAVGGGLGLQLAAARAATIAPWRVLAPAGVLSGLMIVAIAAVYGT